MQALSQAVQRAVSSSAESGGSPQALEAGHELDLALQRYRSSFISLLRNPPKNANERNTLQRGVNEAVNVPGLAGVTKLSETMVREALIISDMFNLSEVTALSLLRAAEEERTLYPGVPRGLIAILFYYDSQELLASSLKTLVQARQGISWVLLPDNEQLSLVITRYLESILNVSLVDRILELIGSMDITKEIELLQQNRAMGDAKHRQLVLTKFSNVRTLLAETLFAWAGQTPMKKDECRRIIAHLAEVKLDETGDGSLDQVNLSLVMALLYSLEVGHVLHSEDITEALGQFPITNDRTFVIEIHRELKSDRQWKTPGLKGVIQLAWGVSLSNLRQVAAATQMSEIEAILEEDEAVLEEATKAKVFNFIQNNILSEKNKPLENFYCQCLHGILSDLIINFPERVKSMKNKADENSRLVTANLREGLQPPTNLEQPFEELLACLATLYSDGQCGDLVEEYWSPSEIMPGATITTRSQGSRQVQLYKFVRLPGDYLPPSLFVPYINLLTSLATTQKASQYVYHFLRVNSQPASQVSNLAWEHFMTALSQYYNNLRHEEPNAMDTMYRVRGAPKGITPQEVQGLLAVVQLVTTVSEHDELSRVALSDNAAWAPLFVCTGLLTCAVPLTLKTQLVRALAAFSKTPTIAQRVWEMVEGAQLVPVIEGVSGYQPRGLLVDIEEVESSREEFPLTLSLLKLFLNLVQAGVPPMLGAGTRQPGIRPYLDLVRYRIFLRHDSRTYKNAGERWAVARGCLEFMYQLLTQPHITTQGQDSATQHPGESLLLDLIQSSQVQKQILSVLHDGVFILEQHREVLGVEDLKASILLILKLLLTAHEQQHHVLSTVSNTEVMLGVDGLMMGLNPHTGASDHLLNVAKLVGHNMDMPNHAALACKLLAATAASPRSQAHLMSLLTTTSATATATRHSFVEVIDHVQLGLPEHAEAAAEALNLMLKFLPLPLPNVAHFLLGYTVEGLTTLRTDLLDAGARGFPRTALHALLAMLPTCPVALVEVAYQLIYALCSSTTTSASTLRYLRSSHDLLYRTVANIILPQSDTRIRLMSQGWILRCVALELRYHATNQQRSQLARLINLLIAGGEFNQPEPLDASLAWGGGVSGGRGPLLTLLDGVDLNIEAPAPLQCEYFTQASQLITSCEENTPDGKVVNLKLLHQKMTSLLQEGGSSAPIAARDPLQEELEMVMNHALLMNRTRGLLAAHKHFLEGWRQVVEVVVAVTPPDLIETPSHHTFLHTLTHDLTRRLLDDFALSDLTTQLVSTMLMLVTTLRTLHARPTQRNIQYVSMLDSTAAGASVQFPSSLQLVLRGLVECVARFRHSSQLVRSSIYAALLNYLQIRADPPNKPEAEDDERLILMQAPRETQEEQFHRENYEVVREDLPQLVDVLAVEAGGGHHVCRVLALTCLDAVAALERRAAPLSMDSPLMSHLSDQGHLLRLLDAIRADDRQLLPLLTASDDDLRPLYVFEARMSLLARLALSSAGAQQLLQAGLTTRLAEMNSLDCRPDQAIQHAADDFLPTAVQRYRTVLTAAVRVCLAVLTSLGTNNYSATAHVLRFLAAHGDALASALQVPSGPAPKALEEMALVSSAVAGAAACSTDIAADPAERLKASQATRLQQLLTALLPHMLPHSRLAVALEQLPENEDGVNVREQARTSILTTLSAILNFTTSKLIRAGTSARDAILIFKPVMEQANFVVGGGSSLTLGTLVECAGQAGQQFNIARSATETAQARLESLEGNQPVENLRFYVSTSVADSASPAAVRKLAEEHLSQVVDLHRQQEQLAVHCAEASALLLWRHLEYFILHAPKMAPGHEDPSGRGIPRSLSQAQVDTLKEKAGVALQDVLPRLQDVNQRYAASTGHVAFLAAAITRIKRLIAS